MKIRVPSSKKILFVKVKVIKAKRITETLSLLNGFDLKIPSVPTVHSINRKNNTITLVLFSKFSKSEISNVVISYWEGL